MGKFHNSRRFDALHTRSNRASIGDSAAYVYI